MKKLAVRTSFLALIIIVSVIKVQSHGFESPVGNKKLGSAGAPPAWLTSPNALNVVLQCSDASGLRAAQSMKPVALNNCDSSPLTLVKTSGAFVPTTCEQTGSYTNTWIANDNCGNSSAIFTQVITIVNNSVPVISPLPALSILRCSESPNFTYPTVTVGCDLHISLTYVDVTTPGSCPSSYKITRTWTAKDACGNTSESVFQTISFVDDQGPVIITPVASLDKVLNCSDEDGLNNALSLIPEAFDECSSTVLIHLTSDVTTPVPGKLSDYVRVRKWNFTDACGNLSPDFTQIITVTDTEKPTITAPPSVIHNADADKCGATGVVLGTPVTADNCSVASVTNNAVEPFTVGSTTVTWTVTDGAGNVATADQIVTVTDVQKPTITAPPPLSVGTDAGKCSATNVVLGSPVTADNCSVASITNNAVEPFPIGSTTVTWTVTDPAGNFATAAQLITVTDAEKPLITAPPPVTVNSDAGKCTATGVILGTPVTSDNCTVVSVTNDAVEPFASGKTSVTWTVTDAGGNVSTAAQIVTVIDTEKPAITAPPALIVNTDAGKCSASGVNPGTPVTSDNCSVASVTYNPTEPFALGNTTITWTVTDRAGNIATATQIITVSDSEKPTIVAPAAVTVNVDSGKCSASNVALGTPVTTDNCSIASVSNDAVEPFPIGSTTVTWTVKDAAGNTSTATQIVTVTDAEKPQITAPVDINIIENVDQCGVSGLNIGTPVLSDNCSIASVTNDAVEPFLPGRTTVTWKVTDVSGNSSTAIQTITVVDNQFPVITAPASVSVSCDPGKSTASGVNTGIPVVSDNCPTSVSNDAVEPFSLGETIVTWYATDTYGNRSSAIQKITVVDSEKPKFTGCTNQVANTDIGLRTHLMNGIDWNSKVSDNVRIASLTYNLSGATSGSGADFNNLILNIGVTTISLLATDSSGNSSSCSFDVTATDNEDPQLLNCSSIDNKEFKTGIGNTTYTIIGNMLDASATDNDRIKSITYLLSGATVGTGSSLNGVTLNIGETNIKWTATDNSGNSSYCLLKVTVLDSNLPPKSTNDEFTVDEGIELSGDVRANDSDLTVSKDMLKVGLVESTTHGKLILKDDGTFTYLPDKDFIGNDHFTYLICTVEGAPLCSFAEVTISVVKNENCAIIVPDSFSPDGDGINDYFKIRCIYNYPEATLKIFTRSGIKVYEQKNYGNTDFWGDDQDAWWNGRSDNKWNVGGTKLASSTYIYVLELEKGNKEKVLTGTVFLNY